MHNKLLKLNSIFEYLNIFETNKIKTAFTTKLLKNNYLISKTCFIYFFVAGFSSCVLLIMAALFADMSFFYFSLYLLLTTVTTSFVSSKLSSFKITSPNYQNHIFFKLMENVDSDFKENFEKYQKSITKSTSLIDETLISQIIIETNDIIDSLRDDKLKENLINFREQFIADAVNDEKEKLIENLINFHDKYYESVHQLLKKNDKYNSIMKLTTETPQTKELEYNL